MGPILPKPVLTANLERKQNASFSAGLSSINGYRENQEDAHAMMFRDDWGFFGVFDGHCNETCSKFTSDYFLEHMAKQKMPLSDDHITQLCFEADKKYLDEGGDGGSTGTFLLAYKRDGGFTLQVGNVGDSRVVVGRRKERKAVSMTEDHKPTNAEETERIQRAGGHVANGRVDGSLAVSRAFGDGNYKDRDDQKLTVRDYKVIVLPEIRTEQFDNGDIVLLCCDGVFEQDVFDNASVMEFIFQQLDKSPDLAAAASAVCHEACERGSKDNISAMIVQIGGPFPHKIPSSGLPLEEFVPGPFAGPEGAHTNEKYRNAYEKMCNLHNISLPECCDRRWDYLQAQLPKRKEATGCKAKTCDHGKLSARELGKLLCHVNGGQQSNNKPGADEVPWDDLMHSLREAAADRAAKGLDVDQRPYDVQAMELELEEMALPEDLRKLPAGNPKRKDYFEKWVEEVRQQKSEVGDPITQKIMQLQKDGLPLPIILGLLAQQQQGAQAGKGGGMGGPGRPMVNGGRGMGP